MFMRPIDPELHASAAIEMIAEAVTLPALGAEAPAVSTLTLRADKSVGVQMPL
jgi:hypothetical protein